MVAANGPTSDGDAADGELGPEFARTFTEPLEKFLDLDTWYAGSDLGRLHGWLQRQVETHIDAGLAAEERTAATLRHEFFPELRTITWRDKPPAAGHYTVSPDELERVRRGVLFSGDVEACDGQVLVHDTLAVTTLQFGVGLIGYRGDEGTWSYRMFRRDLSGGPPSAYADAMDLLRARQAAPGGGYDSHEQVVAELGRRGLATFAQRAVLTSRSNARWKMGRGAPAPFELLSGSGAMRLVESAVAVLRELLLQQRRFVFVPSVTRQRELLTIGYALAPLEFAVLRSLRPEIEDVVERGHLRGRQRETARAFVREAGEQVAVGVFRASAWAPPRVFYAPADPELCLQAATIAIADAALQEHRGYPLLLDVAARFCASQFSREEFDGPIDAAYAARERAAAYLSDL